MRRGVEWMSVALGRIARRGGPAGRAGLAACAALALLALTGTSMAVSSEESATPPVLKGGPDKVHPAVIARAEQELAQARAAAARREAPEAVEERRASESEFADVSDAEARDVILDYFDEVIEAPLWHPPALAQGQSLDRYLGDSGMRVRLADGRRVIMSSTVPLRTKTDAGQVAPTNLELQSEGDALEPKNDVADVQIKRDPGAGIVFGDAGITLDPVPDAPADAAPAVEIEDKAVMTNIGPGDGADVDLIVTPLPAGVETFHVLRSAESPEDLRAELSLPGGARVVLDELVASEESGESAEGPRGAVVVDGEDKVLMRITPPVAQDADGQPVEASFRTDGSSLTIHVDHRDKDLRRPILVDPQYVLEDQMSWYGNASLDMNGWGWYPSAGSFQGLYSGGWGRGLYSYVAPGSSMAAWSFGNWGFVAPNEAYIFRAEWYRTLRYGTLPSQPMCLTQGVYSFSLGWQGNYRSTCSDLINGNDYIVTCTTTNCDPWYASSGTYAVTQHWAYGAGVRSNGDAAYIGGAALFEADAHDPVVTGVTASGVAGWIHPNANGEGRGVQAHTYDKGLGVHHVNLNTPIGGPEQISYHGCNGNRNSRCPNWPGSHHPSFAYDIKSWPEGINRPNIVAGDAIYRTSNYYEWDVKIDKSKPSAINLSGELYDHSEEGTLSRGILDEPYTLNVTAIDGSAGNPTSRSGVKQVKIAVDGIFVGDPLVASCSGQDNCQAQVAWKFDGADYAEGKHTIDVYALDQLAGDYSTTAYQESDQHTLKRALEVVVRHAASAEIGPGSVNLYSGELTLSGTDASVNGFAGSVELSRSHNSRHPERGSDGIFGPGWESSLPVASAGAEYSDISYVQHNTVVLGLADGSEVAFWYSGSGSTWIPAPGYEHLQLDSGALAFTLKDKTSGTEVVFGGIVPGADPQPNYQQFGDGSTTFYQTKVTGPGSENKATMVYEVAGTAPDQVRRPKLAIAPAAAGITCADGAMNTGCRYLEFDYAPANTTPPTGSSLGDYPGRVRNVFYKATNQGPGGETVASYEYDSTGRLREATDPRGTLTTAYAYNASGRVTQITPPGEAAWSMTYVNIADDESSAGVGRLRTVSRATPQGTATETVAYRVSVSGLGDVSTWGQTQTPVTGTAIFPPDQVPTDPPSTYSRATIHYLDIKGRVLNVLAPGDRITTSEYDEHGNAIRELSAGNRARALAGGGSAQDLDTDRTFSADGLDLLTETGPQHEVTHPSGGQVQARRRIRTTYSDHLPAVAETEARLTDGSAVDVRKTVNAYAQHPAVRKPTSVRVDPDGLDVTSRFDYDGTSGLETQRRQPNNHDAGARQTIYYAAGSSPDADCANRPQWANLVCKTKPLAQPGTPGLPDLPVSVYEYNWRGQPSKQIDTSGSGTRTTEIAYDSMGRPATESVTGNVGTSLPAKVNSYHAATGRLQATSTTEGATTRTITRTYDSLGRPTGYQDADANTSTTTYDLLGRVETTNDGKGTQTHSYDPTTGDRTALVDSHAGTFSASYDADGNVVTETYPGGIIATTNYNAVGAPTYLNYFKSTNCTANCTWYWEAQYHTIHGQVSVSSTTPTYRLYAYDKAARLIGTAEAENWTTCTRRDYFFDADSNRTRLDTYPPAADGACTWTNPTATNTGYDDADRMTATGIQYDAFGRITQLPASHAGGHQLTAEYYVNDLARSLDQNGEKHTYHFDPADRLRKHLTTGGDGQERVMHYDGDSDLPAWQTETTSGTQWTRNVSSVAGTLATYDNPTTTTMLQLANLNGDVVGTVPATTAATGLTGAFRYDEYGIPQAGAAGQHRYLGQYQRRTDLPTGVILMGARVYVPQIGRFLQPDPVIGGSCSAYEYVCQDPVNSHDLDGNIRLKRWELTANQAVDLGGRLIQAADVSSKAPPPPLPGIYAKIFAALKVYGAGMLYLAGHKIANAGNRAAVENIFLSNRQVRKGGAFGVRVDLNLRLTGIKIYATTFRDKRFKRQKRNPIGGD